MNSRIIRKLLISLISVLMLTGSFGFHYAKAEESDYKFKVAVSSKLDNGEVGSVTGTVYKNFNAELAIDNAKVSTTNVTVDVRMKNVASLGVNGERHYGRTLQTGMAAREVPLTVVKDLFAGLETATVSAHVEGGEGKVVYTLNNEGLNEETNKFMITGTPDSEANARTVWHEIVNDETVKTAVADKDDSSLTVKKGSVIYAGTDKLLIESDLVFDNLTDFNAILKAIKADGVVTLYEDQEAVEGVIAYLERGSRLQLGSSSAEALQDTKVVIDVESYDESALHDLLKALQQASTPEELIKAGFEGIRTLTAAINGKNTDVTVTFGHQWSEPEWTWTGNDTEGYTAATAVFTCLNNSDHVETVDAEVTSETIEPTKEADGKIIYTAKVTFEGKEYTDVREITIPYEETNVLRIAGRNRARTSTYIADVLKEDLELKEFDTVIIAGGNDYPDALSGSYLAKITNAPILLIRDDRSNDISDVFNYVQKNLAAKGKVYILGGPKALNEEVEKQYIDAGYNVKRLMGGSRYKTNLAVLEEIEKLGGDMSKILICTANGYADSLSASSAGMPILLVNGNPEEGETVLRDDQKAFIAKHDAQYYIIGGTASVNEDMYALIKAEAGKVERVYGANRYQTAIAVANKFVPEPNGVALASSEDFGDGLCGGVLASRLNYSLLFAKEGRVSDSAAYIEEKGIKAGIVFGGEKALTDTAAKAVFALDEDYQIQVYGD